MTRLLGNVDLSHRGRVDKAAIAASQLDWKELQQRHAERWSTLVRHTFGALDTDHDGVIKASDIVEVGAPDCACLIESVAACTYLLQFIIP